MERLFSLGVLAWAIAFFLPMALGLMSLRAHSLAKVCFAISGVVLAGRTIMWVRLFDSPWRYPITFVAFGLVGMGIVESFRWVEKKSSEPAIPTTPTAASPPPPELRFSIRIIEVIDEFDGLHLFYRYPAGSPGAPRGLALAPVGLLLSMEVTPTTGVLSKIEFFTIDIEHNGQWVRLYNLKPDRDRLTEFFTPTDSLRRASQWDFREYSFDAAAWNHPAPVRGWVFLEWPPHLRGVRDDARHFRVTLEDTLGYRQVSERVLSARRPEEPGSSFLGAEGMRLIDPIGSKDLSDIPILSKMDEEARAIARANARSTPTP